MGQLFPRRMVWVSFVPGLFIHDQKPLQEGRSTSVLQVDVSSHQGKVGFKRGDTKCQTRVGLWICPLCSDNCQVGFDKVGEIRGPCQAPQRLNFHTEGIFSEIRTMDQSGEWFWCLIRKTIAET